jgi:hypothetical protein
VPTAADPAVAAQLREEVGRLRQRETRRVFDAVVHVGRLGGPHDSFVVRAQDVPAVDAALRTDLLAAMLEGAPTDWSSTWLTRSGLPVVGDDDLAWLAAARTAYGMHGRELLSCHAVTRYGWVDLVTGDRREWKRLRL